MSRFFILRPDIIQFGRITYDVVRGMSVTDFSTVGNIATWNFVLLVTFGSAFVQLLMGLDVLKGA